MIEKIENLEYNEIIALFESKRSNLEEHFEMLPACPGTAPDAAADFEVLECDLYAVHRDILEDEDDHEHGNQQQIEFPVVQDTTPEPA